MSCWFMVLCDRQISAGWAAGWVFAALCWQLCESTKLLASLSASVWNCMTVVISAIYLICHLTAGDETALLLWHDSVFSNEEYSEVRDSFLFCFFTCEMKSFMSLSPYLWDARYDVVVSFKEDVNEFVSGLITQWYRFHTWFL